VGDVTSRTIPPATYGERCTAVARADWRARQPAITGLSGMLEEPGGPPSFPETVPCVSRRGGQGTMAASGVAPGGVPNPLPHPGAARIIRPARLLG
jgi:hypothetical protein